MKSLDLKQWLVSQGAAVAGVADLEELSGYPTLPESVGGKALAIPASHTLDRKAHFGNLSH